jgi:hypothetical protein
VFLDYASGKGTAFVHGVLHLPREQAEDTDRFAKAGNLDYSAFHDDSSLPVIFSSLSMSVL